MNNLIKTLSFVLGIALMAAGQARAAETVTYYHHDVLGSVIASSNEYGGINWNEEYQPYGKKIYDTVDTVGDSDEFYTGKNFNSDIDLTYFGARWYDDKQGRFLSMDPAPVNLADPHTFNRYHYANNNPYKYVDPDGEEVRVQWHEVAFDQYHTLITIKPDNQGAYKNDPRFSNTDSAGRRYATIGGGPVFGKLVSDINRGADRELHSGGNLVQLPSSVKNEDQFIKRLFELDANYGDNLDYDLSPANPSDQVWYRADDGYNSNSYVSGLLNASGGAAKKPNVNVPGYDKPVPKNEFQP